MPVMISPPRFNQTVTLVDQFDGNRLKVRDVQDPDDDRTIAFEGTTVFASLDEVDEFADALKALVATHREFATRDGDD